MVKTFESHGKLMITGEYFVLRGAKSFLIPTKFSQEMKIEIIENNSIIDWTSYNEINKKWFSAKFCLPSLKIVGALTKEKLFLKKILDFIKLKRPKVFKDGTGLKIITNMDFRRNWGLGSSAMLINNLSRFYGLNPFEVSENTTNSSGADIAASLIGEPIVYSLIESSPKYFKADFNPPFSKNLLFVFLNKKQSSNNEVKKFNSLDTCYTEINTISQITNEIINCKDINDFNYLIEKHESFISKKIKKEPVKKKLFKDFEGSIKSLGAWGGDFILACGKNISKSYFTKKGFNTSFSLDEILK